MALPQHRSKILDPRSLSDDMLQLLRSSAASSSLRSHPKSSLLRMRASRMLLLQGGNRSRHAAELRVELEYRRRQHTKHTLDELFTGGWWVGGARVQTEDANWVHKEDSAYMTLRGHAMGIPTALLHST